MVGSIYPRLLLCFCRIADARKDTIWLPVAKQLATSRQLVANWLVTGRQLVAIVVSFWKSTHLLHKLKSNCNFATNQHVGYCKDSRLQYSNKR